MRYQLPTDRLINQIVPHYLSGRRIILFLQSLVWPLKTLNDRFVEFAREKSIDARMTSQVIWFEWYLNHRFNKYLFEPTEKIVLSEGEQIGVDIYHENAQDVKPFTVWFGTEPVITADPMEEPRRMYLSSEEKAVNKASFIVCVPEIRIPEHEFVYMLSHVVNTYKIAGKTYLIKINREKV